MSGWRRIIFSVSAWFCLSLVATAEAADRVVLQMRWDNQFQFAGIYAADWQGYYEQAGLDVEIRSAFAEDGKLRVGFEEVSAGRAQFGIGGAEILTARDRGVPIVIVTTIFQQSPIAIFARKEVDVHSPADLTRVTVWREPTQLSDIEMQAVLRKEGIDPDKVTGLNGADAVGSPFNHLAAGEIDAYAGYRLTALWRAKQKKIRLTVLTPSAYGVDFCGDTIFASKTFAERHPDVVRRFVDATLEGWRYALENPDEIAERIATTLPRRYPVEDLLGFNRFQAEEVRKLMLYPVVQMGRVNPDRWRRMHEILKQGGLVTGDFDESVIFDPERDRANALDRALLLVTATVAFVAALLVLTFAWLWALKRTVARQTVDLRTEIAERQKSEAALHLYANAFKGSGEAMLITDAENWIVNVNPAFSALTGYSLDDVVGQNPKLLASGLTPRETYDAMWSELRTSGYWQGELWDRGKSGRVYPNWATISVVRDDAGRVTHHMASFSDISERKAAEEQIHHLAHYDALTGLLNRFSLENRLEQALLSARRSGDSVAVMFIDMDRFKTINDTLGHHVGDKLLKEVANRLGPCVRESDIVARQGGDEFVVVLTGLAHPGIASRVAAKIVDTLSLPYSIGPHDLHSSPSIGIGLYPADGKDVDSLMRVADTAMYRAKDLGRKNYQFYSEQMMAASNERMEIERDLPIAMSEGQFELFYQPQVCTPKGRLHGFEALIRWNHPDRGYLSPDTFIPVAEQIGLIEQIGSWVLHEACRKLADWKRLGLEDVRMAVNISRYQLRSAEFVDEVRQAIQDNGLSGSDLELEVTETVAMSDAKQAVESLRGLKDLGVGLAIDDFGTGYSSLAYLKRFPIDVLKLDREFVRELGHDENASAISAATVAMAHSMGLKVVAKGVETETHRRFLAGHNCDYLQGYLLGKPMNASHWESAWQTRAASALLHVDAAPPMRQVS